MEKNKLQWKRIAKGDKLPCQSFLRKKNGEILKLSTGAGVTVGQDAYYLPVDDVIEEIRNYPIEEFEDERIRKALIKLVKKAGEGYENVIDGVSIENAIAWLEKKGESSEKIEYNPFDDFSNSDVEVDSNEDGLIAETIRYKKEQKSAEWSEEDEEIYRRCICSMRASACGFPEEEKFVEKVDNWLKSLKDRVQSQPKQEWSEEDKKLIDDTCHLINKLASGYGEKVTEPITFSGTQMIASIKDKLRALVDNRPKSQWRPSENQMSMLRAIINEPNNSGSESCHLAMKSLYDDLSKLK